ncbi:MAG: hypothetical protein H0U74_07465 [Bradymonadaceae bacterium]|nr:hypothetical protein [Lujinxingiaceae bacterium]
MSPSSLRRPMMMTALVTALLAAFATAGCDEIRFREGGGLTQAPVMQTDALRVLVTPRGLESLYRTSSPAGFGLDNEPLWIDDATRRLRFGPLEQDLAIERWAVTPLGEAMIASLVLIKPTIYVPVRVQDNISVQICRFAVTMDAVDIRATINVATTSEGVTLGGASHTEVEISGVKTRPIGPCVPLDGERWTLEESLDDLLLEYVEEGLTHSANAAFRDSPLDTLGLIRRRVELSRVSAFENRRGNILVIGQMAATDPIGLSSRGLEAGLDMAISQRRAGCAPAVGLDAPNVGATAPIPVALLEQFTADVGLAIATPLLERTAQAATSAGFICRGLEDPRPADENREVIPGDSLRLEDIGLAHVPIGPWARLLTSPGSLPRLKTRPDRNDILLSWENLTVDLYAEVYGVLVRIVSITTSVELGLRPRADLPGLIGFDVDTVEVQNVQLSSPWLADAPDDNDRNRWARRLLFLALDGQFSLPLPLDPGTPLRVVGSQVRADDLVLMLRFTP